MSVNADFKDPVFPFTISDSSTRVEFSVDSTWHMIEGRASNIHGQIHQSKPSDLKSITGNIIFPVMSFDTQNSMRDKRLKEVMNEKEFPNVEFIVNGSDGSCNLAKLESGPNLSCIQTLKGKLKIKDVTKDLAIPCTLSLDENGELSIEGMTSFTWREFQIEDPSILIAKLYEDVQVKFNIILSKR